VNLCINRPEFAINFLRYLLSDLEFLIAFIRSYMEDSFIPGDKVGDNKLNFPIKSLDMACIFWLTTALGMEYRSVKH
jgi:hypothetical protein